MNKRLLTAIAGGIALAASATSSFAQTAAEASTANLFPSLLAEARSKTPPSSDAGIINTSLSTAEWHWQAGEHAEAMAYLNFARGKLGLRPVAPDTAAQQAGRTR